MKLLSDPVGNLSLRRQALLWLIPLLSLAYETDLTALLWLGSTTAILLTSASARQSVFAMIYRNWWTTLAVGVGIGLLFGALINPAIDGLAETITGSEIDLSQFADVEGDSGAFIELLIVAILFGGVVEEACFRGFFIGWGVTLFGKRWAIPILLVSSAVFGMGHLYQSPAGALSTGLFALIVGGLYLALGRKLLPVILIHAVSNAWGVTEIYLGAV
nr:CPBP family intramembrane glutamic endopeptidase [Sphingomicrobium nitratireducens]